MHRLLLLFYRTIKRLEEVSALQSQLAPAAPGFAIPARAKNAAIRVPNRMILVFIKASLNRKLKPTGGS
jgi:hypothetical protein